MLLGEAGCLFFVGFILHISGAHGQADRKCVLKGLSVQLPCLTENHTSSKQWYTLHWNESRQLYNLNPFSGDENHTWHSSSAGSNFTLTISEVRENDRNVYCCGGTDELPGPCWFHRIYLEVADLQVKVIPTTEEQTVTLMCSTSCPLTENPAAYVWYKNREFLYEDWSPWYQELVGSEEAATYSCAVKGYEDLRAPEVSVDSITPTCFTVTYAKGKMCSHDQTSADEPCSITYPREVYFQGTPVDNVYFRLTCTPSCSLTDPQTVYKWYRGGHLYKFNERQDLTVPIDHYSTSCAIKDHEDLRTGEFCTDGKSCSTVDYRHRRICALQGSSVIIASEYVLYPKQRSLSKLWFKIKRGSRENAKQLIEVAGRVEYQETNGSHILIIKNLRKDDSAEYKFKLQSFPERLPDFPGVTLVVSGLEVRMTPSAEVTEGQRVTLTCSTSCPLPINMSYMWYLNSRPLTLPQGLNKHLVLDPVSGQHAGNYSCAVKTDNISSPEEILVVRDLPMLMVYINTARLILALLILILLLVFHLSIR